MKTSKQNKKGNGSDERSGNKFQVSIVNFHPTICQAEIRVKKNVNISHHLKDFCYIDIKAFIR